MCGFTHTSGACLPINRTAIGVRLEFQNGTIAHLESAWILPDGGGVSTDDALEVLGTKGKSSISLDEGPLTLRTGSGVSYPDTLYEAPVFGERFGGLAAELSDFVRSVAQAPAPTGESRRRRPGRGSG